MALQNMTPYERKAWDDLERWRTEKLNAKQRHRVPEPVRRRSTQLGKSAREKFDDVPGSELFVETLRKSLDGLMGVVSKSAEASLRRGAIVNAYAKRTHPVTTLEDIRALDLRDIDKIKPRIGLRYTSASMAEGAVAGLIVSGGEIIAAGGAVFGAGAGAAPGAGLIVGTMAADAVAVLAASVRVIAHTAAYYGYDTELPEDQLFAAGVLSFGLAKQAGKSAAYVELNKLVQALARKATWEQLNKNAATQVVKIVYERLGVKLTKEKLGQAVPVLGVALGAGSNALLLSRLSDDANHLYRERFLREKYRLDIPATASSADLAEAIPIVEIVEQELDGPDANDPS